VVFWDGRSVAERPVDADAPPATAKDMPAIPNTGNALLRRFRFEACFARAIESPPIHTANDCANRLRRQNCFAPA
jgi:hypothetical protein